MYLPWFSFIRDACNTRPADASSVARDTYYSFATECSSLIRDSDFFLGANYTSFARDARDARYASYAKNASLIKN